MAGAPSHTDTFDLKKILTPAVFKPTSYGNVRWPQGLMPNLANQLDSITLLRSLTLGWVHGLMQTWMQSAESTGIVEGRSPHRLDCRAGIQSGKQSTLPGLSRSTGRSPARAPSTEHVPFLAGSGLPNTTHRDGIPRFEARYGLLQDIDHEMRYFNDIGPAPGEMGAWNERARLMMYNSAIDNVVNFNQTEKNRYGNSGFGNACITARNLIQAGLGTRFIQITFGSWDHHTNIYVANTQLKPIATQFDNGLATLISDLKAAGLLDQTLIVAQGEFGRTVGPPNSNGGRDHLQQQAVLFAGGGVKVGLPSARPTRPAAIRPIPAG